MTAKVGLQFLIRMHLRDDSIVIRLYYAVTAAKQSENLDFQPDLRSPIGIRSRIQHSVKTTSESLRQTSFAKCFRSGRSVYSAAHSADLLDSRAWIVRS